MAASAATSSALPMGPTAMRYLDAILGNLRSAGFSIENAAHTFWLLDSYVYGHVIQEISVSWDTSNEMSGSARSDLGETTMDEYPHLVEVGEHAMRSGHSLDREFEFEFDLDLILDAMSEHRGRSSTDPPPHR